MPKSPISPAEMSRNIVELGIDTIAVFSCATGLTFSIPWLSAALPSLFMKAVAINKLVTIPIIRIKTTFFFSFAIKLFPLFIKSNSTDYSIFNLNKYKNYAI